MTRNEISAVPRPAKPSHIFTRHRDPIKYVTVQTNRRVPLTVRNVELRDSVGVCRRPAAGGKRRRRPLTLRKIARSRVTNITSYLTSGLNARPPARGLSSEDGQTPPCSPACRPLLDFEDPRRVIKISGRTDGRHGNDKTLSSARADSPPCPDTAPRRPTGESTRSHSVPKLTAWCRGASASDYNSVNATAPRHHGFARADPNVATDAGLQAEDGFMPRETRRPHPVIPAGLSPTFLIGISGNPSEAPEFFQRHCPGRPTKFLPRSIHHADFDQFRPFGVPYRPLFIVDFGGLWTRNDVAHKPPKGPQRKPTAL